MQNLLGSECGRGVIHHQQFAATHIHKCLYYLCAMCPYYRVLGSMDLINDSLMQTRGNRVTYL